MTDIGRGETKVGDVGTVYYVPTYDDDLEQTNFDPSAALTKRIVFKMPGAPLLLTRAAQATQVPIDGTPTWCLAYTVVAADVVPGGFHQAAGPVSLEGYVEFSPAQKWASQTVTRDHLGRQLQVGARLK